MKCLVICANAIRRRARTFAVASVAVIAFLVLSCSGVWAGPSPGEPAEGLYVVDPTGSSPKLVMPGEEDEPNWSPDGRWISVFDTNTYDVKVVDPANGIRQRVDSVLWSHDGSRLAYATR